MSQRLIPVAAAAIATPPTGKYWFFLNSSDSNQPCLKNDAGVVSRLSATSSLKTDQFTVSGTGPYTLTSTAIGTNIAVYLDGRRMQSGDFSFAANAVTLIVTTTDYLVLQVEYSI